MKGSFYDLGPHSQEGAPEAIAGASTLPGATAAPIHGAATATAVAIATVVVPAEKSKPSSIGNDAKLEAAASVVPIQGSKVPKVQ